MLDGVRRETCRRSGIPRAPERDQGAVGPQVVGASYAAFDQGEVVVSDERYEP